MREPCTECGEASFGYFTADDRGGHLITAVVEYHADACPLLANGPYVIATMPRDLRKDRCVMLLWGDA